MAPKYADPIDPDEVISRMLGGMGEREKEIDALPPLFNNAIEATEDDGAMGVAEPEPLPPVAKWAKK